MLGHQDASLTLNTYAGLFDDDLDDVAERLGRPLPTICPLTPWSRLQPLRAWVLRRPSDLRKRRGAPGRIRTGGTRFRKPLLYPLSYGGLGPAQRRTAADRPWSETQRGAR
jgi:hypothetical protein